MFQVILDWQDIFLSMAILAGAAVLGLVAHWVMFRVLVATRLLKRNLLSNSLLHHGRGALRLVLPLLVILIVLPAVPLSGEAIQRIRHVVSLGVIAGIAWGVIALSAVADDLVSAKYPIDVKDNLRARQVKTQVHVLRRIFVAITLLVAGSIMLMTFPSIRNLGASLLASAGLAGLIAGIAAQSTLKNFVAGIQLALTEPIRLDDVVIVEGEWGRIEEIGTTYVVVCIWDHRRLVVPLSRFIEQPFENWTRRESDILGTVFLHVDYTVPVDRVREELHRILREKRELWDGEVWGLQVTGATDRTMELRALMGAPDSGSAWDLRCYVREKLIEFLQREYPNSLPRIRAEMIGEVETTYGAS